MPKIVTLPGGTLMAIDTARTHPTNLLARYSDDHGDTWSELKTILSLADMPPNALNQHGVEATLDADGELHIFLLHQWKPDSRGEGERGGPGTYYGERLDIWHARSTAGRTNWQIPKCIWKGYTGSLNSSLTLPSGRIILPFSYYVNRTWSNRGKGLEAYSFYGMFISTALYSDDRGATWRQANDLKVATPDIQGAYGACEPVAIARRDGSAWMLIRTQMGRFYESFSKDGAAWSDPRPTALLSSDSPAGIVRLPDGRLVLIWNNCLRYPYAYGGRQVIHAAISKDDGGTWRGFREVGWDPKRFDPPPPDGDFGTAYPFPAVTAKGQVIISTGQGAGRTILMRLDPDYLTATRQKTDFKRGIDDWSVFGTRGVGLASLTGKTGRRALELRRVDPEFPAAAVWNFPMARRGQLRLRFRIQPQCSGMHIGLTDHFSVPFDFEDVLYNVFHLRLRPSGVATPTDRLAGSGNLAISANRLHELRLIWDTPRRSCLVRVDGRLAQRLPMRHETLGISYLRLRTSADSPEKDGFSVDAAEAVCSNDK